MRPYKMLDDIPRWKYIFNQEDLSVKVALAPYILYRIGSGVLLNVNNEKRKDFLVIPINACNTSFYTASLRTERSVVSQ